MALTDFINQWEEREDTIRLVNSMTETRENPGLFKEPYSEFRDYIGKPWNRHPFPEYSEFDDETVESILLHAVNYGQGLENHTLTYARNDLENILDGVREKLGDSNFVDYLAILETRVDEPEDFVDRIKSYKEILKPLSRDNPQPEVIKNKLISKIDNVVGSNPDEKTKAIAEALKGIYESERSAASAYAHIFVRPERDSVKEIINANDNWKNYMTSNLDKHTRREKIEFFTDMYRRFKED